MLLCVYIYIWRHTLLWPRFCLKTHFCWGFKAKLSQQNSHFLCRFFSEISFVWFFHFLLFSLCLPLFSLSLSPSLQKKLGHRRASRLRYIYIYAYNLIRWATFRLQKIKKQRERWKTKARKGKDEKEDKTFQTGEKLKFWPFFGPLIEVIFYIYIYAVKLKTGPRFGVL